MERKYIIVKDKLGKLRHYKSEWEHHGTIARDNGFDTKDILECGMFLDKEIFILECVDKKHLLKRADRNIGDRLNYYQDIKLREWLKVRELESTLYYSKKIVGLREGD